MDVNQLKIEAIVWQHRSRQTPLYIARRLRVKLWQVENYIKQVEDRIGRET